jgi:hypothetical protein
MAMLIPWICVIVAGTAFGYASRSGRGTWELLTAAMLIYSLVPLLRLVRRTCRRTHRRRHVRLGQLLVHTYGWITPGQLRRALAQQRGTRKLLGAILLEMGVLTAMQLETALERQRRVDAGLVSAGSEAEREDQAEALLPAR